MSSSRTPPPRSGARARSTPATTCGTTPTADAYSALEGGLPGICRERHDQCVDSGAPPGRSAHPGHRCRHPR
ncbi:hypothetical protein ACFFX0_07910 [Citricoccus parietis]|uniref:Uncharacterized protein n=1 Tax=Citricoccus parietis TaxID=592307 RepID=A0ABV5FWT1_9MICC